MTLEPFAVEFSKRAQKDLKRVPAPDRKKILSKSETLCRDPFPTGKTIKRIKGVKFPCYRLRVDGEYDSYRVFYGIEDKTVLVLRIVSRKSADKIIKSLMR